MEVRSQIENPQSVLEDGIVSAFDKHLDKPVVVKHLRRLTGGAAAEIWSFDAIVQSKSFSNTESGGQTLECILRRSTAKSSSGSISSRTEALVQQVALQHQVPAAKVLFILSEEDGMGEGYFMVRDAGETIPRKILRDDEYSAARNVMTAQCGTILAKIHKIPVASITDCLDAPLPEQSAQDSVEQFYKRYKYIGQPLPVFETAIQWLRDNLPRSGDLIGGLRVVHGDFRNGNFIVGPEGIRTVIDWEICHLGDPMEDLGWLCVNSWRFGNIDLPVGGFGRREDLIQAYESGSGETVDINELRFWEVFGSLKWGIVCLMHTFSHIGNKRRSVELAAIGRRVSEVEIDLLNLIYDKGL